jgi:hypothetical protein
LFVLHMAYTFSRVHVYTLMIPFRTVKTACRLDVKKDTLLNI